MCGHYQGQVATLGTNTKTTDLRQRVHHLRRQVVQRRPHEVLGGHEHVDAVAQRVLGPEGGAKGFMFYT